jgi:hypothetical protein
MLNPSMRIVIDDQPCKITAGAYIKAVNAAAAVVQERGRMIVEVAIDGEPVELCDLEKFDANRQSTKTSEIQITTADPIELVGQVLKDAAAALEEADAQQQSAAESIQAGKLPQAMQSLSIALGIWSSVQQALAVGAQVPGLDLMVELASDHHQQAVERLNTHLRAIRSALETRDPVGISDTLLYDLPDVVVQWRSLLHELRQRLTANV